MAIPNTRNALIQSAKWTAIFFITGTLVAALVPFPYWLIVLLAIILGTTLIIGTLSFRSWMESIDKNIDSGKIIVKYFCMNCGLDHNESSCPNCGSRIKRVSF